MRLFSALLLILLSPAAFAQACIIESTSSQVKVKSANKTEAFHPAV